MRNADYWRQRARINSDAAHAEANEYIAQLEDIYREAVMSVQADIDRWYGRFADNNQITLAEAKKWLTEGELEEFHWSVDKYIKAAEKHGLDPAWQKKLENASARYHISRLEAIQMQIQQQAELVYGNQMDGLDELLRRIADNGYNHAAFDVMKGVGMGWDFAKLDQKRLNAMLKKPWTSDGKTFTDRCWEGKANLIDGIQQELVQSLMRGDSLVKTRDHIAQRFGVSKYKAGRLAHTEATYFNAVSTQACYEDLGVERIEIVETLDKHTCEICAAMDGKVIDKKDYQPGVTVPPFHPNCRGTTCPWFDDMEDVGRRIARDNEGEVYYVPPDMTYREWEKTFQEGGSKDGLAPVTAAEGELNGEKKNVKSGLTEPANSHIETGESLKGYSPEQQETIRRLLDQAPPEIKDLFNEFGTGLKPATEQIDRTIGHAYFHPADGRVHMLWAEAAKGGIYEEPFKLHFHEYAHNLDYLAGGRGYFSTLYRTKEGLTFEQVIERDWEKGMKDFFRETAEQPGSAYQNVFDTIHKKNGLSGTSSMLSSDIGNWRRLKGLAKDDPAVVSLKEELTGASGSKAKLKKFYADHFDIFGELVYDERAKEATVKAFARHMTDTYSERELSDLSDMFERFSVQHNGPERPFGFGHGKEKAVKTGHLAREAFAEMTSAMITSPGSLSLIQKCLPNAYHEYLSMLEVMVR